MKKIQLTLILLLMAMQWPSALNAEFFSLDEVDKEKYVQHYNGLPAVEKADEDINKKTQFQSFLKKAEQIVRQYELQPIVGLRLIHNHFLVGNNNVMSEDFQIVKEIPSLVTSEKSFEEAYESGALPASWIFSKNNNGEISLFEASNDPFIKTAHSLLKKTPDFFDEMGKVLREYELTDLIALAILKRDSLVPKDGQIYMEANSLLDQRSVIQLYDEKDVLAESIPTSWSFNTPRQHMCMRFSYCDKNSDGTHTKGVEHKYVDPGC